MNDTTDIRLAQIAQEMLRAGVTLPDAVTRFERAYIATAMERSGRRQRRAAQILGVHRNTIRNRTRQG